jgi:N-acetylmuramoyl-L-alanine amidase
MKLLNALSGGLNTLVVVSVLATSAYANKSFEVDNYVSSFSKEEIYCMQQNIYFEARNQDITGQASVAWVTLNRLFSTKFPSTICDVVWQNKQFSWTHDGKSDTPKEISAWERAGNVVKMVLEDYAWGKDDPTHGATHYHANYVSPYWVSSFSPTTVIGIHVFYK